MPLTNTASRYGGVTKTFHWLTALLIFALLPLGLIANRLPYDTNEQLAQKAWLFSIHKTLGVLVFGVALLRILWAISQPKPDPLHPDRKGETVLAEIVHWLLYGSLVLAPLSGWLHHAATAGFAPIWWPFGQDLPLVPKDEGVAHLFGGLHWLWTKVLALSIVLHVAGALKHHFVDKDATLVRMWFGRTEAAGAPVPRAHWIAPAVAAAIFALTGAGVAATQSVVNSAADAITGAIGMPESGSEWQVLDGTLSLTVLQLGSEVTGTFSDWAADISFDPDTQSGDVTVEVAIGSLTLGSVTDQAMGRDFFDVESHPTARFEGPITNDGGATYLSNGTLTLKGESVPVLLSFDLIETDGIWQMDGVAMMDRRDFGIGDQMADETNLGFGVEVNVDLQAQRTE